MKNTRDTGKLWVKLRKDLDLPMEYQLYSLRDSGIVQLLNNGVAMQEVSKQADHSSLEITSKYAIHANKKASAQILDKCSDF